MSRPTDDSLDMIRRLIAFDTTSRNSNLELIGFVRDHLERHGAAVRLVHGPDVGKSNLFATLGPVDRPGIALSGHTDVVPVDGQDWSTDPWTATERDGRLYGRGTCDMKGFIGLVLAKVPEFARRGLATPLHFAFSFDEEIGCVGVRHLLKELERAPIRPAACIIGEPTEMRVVVGHKGKKSVRCRVRGVEGHSSLAPRCVNAVEMAAEIVTYLRHMGVSRAEAGPFDPDFDVPHTTVHTGVIRGGTALNIVPRSCWFEFEFRTLPAEDVDALFREVREFAEAKLAPAMRAIAPEAGFEWEDLSEFPGLETAADEAVVALAKALTGANATAKVAFGTEAGLFQAAGIPTVVCGPGSIEQAHKPNEFVTLEQLAQCAAFLSRLADHVCAR